MFTRYRRYAKALIKDQWLNAVGVIFWGFIIWSQLP